jgi:hypothetical protein
LSAHSDTALQAKDFSLSARFDESLPQSGASFGLQRHAADQDLVRVIASLPRPRHIGASLGIHDGLTGGAEGG